MLEITVFEVGNNYWRYYKFNPYLLQNLMILLQSQNLVISSRSQNLPKDSYYIFHGLPLQNQLIRR